MTGSTGLLALAPVVVLELIFRAELKACFADRADAA
jgi:hypothetical protein